MLETIRQYAMERLIASGKGETVSRRHAESVLALAELAEPELTARQQDTWLDRLETEHNNVRAALGWMLQRGDRDGALQLSGALWRFWLARGYLEEGRRWLEAALAGDGGEPLARAKALLGAGVLLGEVEPAQAEALLGESLDLYRSVDDMSGVAPVLMELGSILHQRGEHEQAVVLQTESVALFRQLGNTTMVAQLLNNLGNVATDRGDYDRAASLIGEGLALSREMGDTRAVAIALLSLGAARAEQHEYEQALPLYTEGLALFRRLGDRDGAALCLLNLGEVAVAQERFDAAAPLLEEGLTLAYEVGSKRSIAYCLEGIARLNAARGSIDAAACIWGAAEKVRDVGGIPLPPAIQASFERDLQGLRCLVGEETWKRAWGRGRAMTVKDAVAEALEKGRVG
jgi:tetratricopeptide (TPR) repeat protein